MNAVTSTASPTTRLLLVERDASVVSAALAQYGAVFAFGSAEAHERLTAEALNVEAFEMLPLLTASEERVDPGAAQWAAVAAAHEAVAARPGDAVVLCASGKVLVTLVCYALGVPLEAGARFRIDPGAVTVIEVDAEGRWALVRLNERRPPADS